MVKRVAVLGAGCSGLTAIKCCLDEGLEPVCFEKSVDIGGLWRFKEVPEDGRASIYNSVIINTSKEMMCYSDYQIPDEYPNYMHNSKVLQYFRSYAEHFQLLKYIRFQTAVCSIQKHPDYLTTGQWDIVTETDGKQEKHVFDAILVCTGHHAHPKLPLDSFPGIEKFKGQYFHSREYKNPEPFKNKKIIVIGIGNTAVDLVVELSAVAKQVYMSTRRGAWLVNRVCDNGFPLDVVYFTRFRAMLQTKFPAMVDTYMESKFNSRVDHDNFGLKPKHRFFSQHPTISDDLPNRIISGRVIMKTNIKCFTETDVHFEDGSVEKDIDVVIFATGYSFSFPYIDESVIKVKHNEVPLYKMVFPPHLEKPTMAFIGYIQPVGAIMPVSEIQSRWATRVFKGLAKLPSMEKMKEETVKRREDLQKRYVKSERHTIQVDYVPYMDEIATEVGCMPNWKQLFLTDPKLAWQVLFGPCTPYQYRLCGPGKWNNARKAILSQTERIIKPTKTRNTECEMTNGPFNMLFKLFGILMVFAAIYAMM